MPDSLFSGKIPDITLERFALRELPASEMRALAARLETDPVLQERLRLLKESGAAILRATPPEQFAERIQALRSARDRKTAVENSIRTAGARTSGAWSFGAWKPLLGSLALLVVLAVPIGLLGPRGSAPRPAAHGTGGAGQGMSVSTPAPSPATSAIPAAPAAPSAPASETPLVSSEDDIRLKGLEPHLAIFRKTDSGAQPVHPGEKAQAGEVLRIGYQAAGFPYGAILSVDGNGNVTRHWPAEGDRAGRLQSGDALLPSSFELDAAPDYERFYFVVSKRPFTLDPLLKSLHENESLPNPEKIKAIQNTDVRIVRFEVLKESGI